MYGTHYLVKEFINNLEKQCKKNDNQYGLAKLEQIKTKLELKGDHNE